MPAAAFARMNRQLQRAFAHKGSIVWHRPGGPAEGHKLAAWFNSTSEEVDADGYAITTARPTVTVFVADILAIDPSRAGNDNEILRNDGAGTVADTLTVDGVRYRVESCTADGHGKSVVQLRKA